jgi:hypothetical protein
MTPPPTPQPRFSVRMDARLDGETRTTLDQLATGFCRSKAAVLREVMRWGRSHGPQGPVDGDKGRGPVHHLFVLVEAALQAQVRDAAAQAGSSMAAWLRQQLRQITRADVPASWQAGDASRRRPTGGRSHDSR